VTHRITLLQKEAEKLAETLGQFIPDESRFSPLINGLCYGDLGDSASGCCSAQRFCHTGGV
jgi:hypothetical protein